MGFSKKFPVQREGTPYADWQEVFLTKEEEAKIEEDQRFSNVELMKECINDAKKIFFNSELKDFQSDLIRVAVALFEKRASHLVYWKEEFAKEKLYNSLDKKKAKSSKKN